MKEFNTTSCGNELPSYPHDGYCSCKPCTEVYDRRKEILANENKELMQQISNVNTIEISYKILSAAVFIIAMLSFLAGVLIDKAVAIFLNP